MRKKSFNFKKKNPPFLNQMTECPKKILKVLFNLVGDCFLFPTLEK